MKGPFMRTMGETWWLGRLVYFRVMLREVSSFFIAAYLVFFMILLYTVSKGEAAYNAYMEFLGSTGMTVFHFTALGFALIHTISWFNLTPKAMVVWRGEDKLPPVAMIVPNYVAWLGLSAGILWLVWS